MNIYDAITITGVIAGLFYGGFSLLKWSLECPIPTKIPKVWNPIKEETRVLILFTYICVALLLFVYIVEAISIHGSFQIISKFLSTIWHP